MKEKSKALLQVNAEPPLQNHETRGEKKDRKDSEWSADVAPAII